jgi:hypothetical protein
MGIVAGAGVFKEVERPHAVTRRWTSPDPICSTLMDMGTSVGRLTGAEDSDPRRILVQNPTIRGLSREDTLFQTEVRFSWDLLPIDADLLGHPIYIATAFAR